MELSFITDNWPQLAKYIPASALELRLRRDEILDGLRIDGYCDWLTVPPDRWLGRLAASEKYPAFVIDPSVPQSYFACGIHLHGNFSEYMFAMWRCHRRRFWFCQRFFSTRNPEGHSAGRAAEALDKALEQWESGAESVMYDGERGWFVPETKKWRF